MADSFRQLARWPCPPNWLPSIDDADFRCRQLTDLSPPRPVVPNSLPPLPFEPATAATTAALGLPAHRGSGDLALGDPRQGDAGPTDRHAVWAACLGQLRKIAGRAATDTWLQQAQLAELSADPLTGACNAVLQVPDQQVALFVGAHYASPLTQALEELLGVPVNLRCQWHLPEPPLAAPSPRVEAPILPALPSLPVATLRDQPAVRQAALWPDAPAPAASPAADWQDLAERFTFEQFIVGQANEIAASAAKSVAAEPAAHYNPLFLHGGVGLGKTHLLHAIGHLCRQLRPNLRVRYVAAETYVDDVYSAWRSRDSGTRGEVRAHYRDQVDVLLLDDVQFLQGNDKLGEEFFHLFNALHNAGKQVVLTCDRYPAELHGLHERLRSRFQWGLTAELAPPDRELRMAILRHKAAQLRLSLPPDVVFYLADHLCNNVRELEGALHKLAAHARIGRRSIDLALTRAALGPVIELPSRNLTAEVIQRATAQHFGVKITDLKGGKRHKAVVLPRMVAMYLIRKHTSASFPEIGKLFGGRDHTTVMHGCRKIEFDIANDLHVQTAVAAVETALGK